MNDKKHKMKVVADNKTVRCPLAAVCMLFSPSKNTSVTTATGRAGKSCQDVQAHRPVLQSCCNPCHDAHAAPPRAAPPASLLAVTRSNLMASRLLHLQNMDGAVFSLKTKTDNRMLKSVGLKFNRNSGSTVVLKSKPLDDLKVKAHVHLQTNEVAAEFELKPDALDKCAPSTCAIALPILLVGSPPVRQCCGGEHR
jgi:hypothetical protein